MTNDAHTVTHMPLPAPKPESTCLVTGASSGIGREFARELARRGYGVTVVARREDRLTELVAELERNNGTKADFVVCDLADAEDRKKLFETVAGRGRNVELLVNNAGMSSVGKFTELDHEDQLRMIRLNCEALQGLTREYLPGMVERNRGGVINIASVAAYQPMPFASVYGGAKAFVLSFSAAVNSELKGSAVNVTVISPGPVPTELPELAGTSDDLERAPNIMIVSPEKVAREAVEAFDHGRLDYIPGRVNAIFTRVARPLPTSVKLPLARRVFKRSLER